MKDILKLQAELCKIFANDKRLEIINLLREKEMSTGELMQMTGLSKVSMSQHMNVLKSKGVIAVRREGVQLYYTIDNPKIIQASDLMKDVLFEQLRERQREVSHLVENPVHPS